MNKFAVQFSLLTKHSSNMTCFQRTAKWYKFYIFIVKVILFCCMYCFMLELKEILPHFHLIWKTHFHKTTIFEVHWQKSKDQQENVHLSFTWLSYYNYGLTPISVCLYEDETTDVVLGRYLSNITLISYCWWPVHTDRPLQPFTSVGRCMGVGICSHWSGLRVSFVTVN